MKPENIPEMLALDGCEKIILFPYFPLDDKKAYYELTLDIEKDVSILHQCYNVRIVCRACPGAGGIAPVKRSQSTAIFMNIQRRLKERPDNG